MDKLRIYEKHGFREYWIINPEAQYLMIYHLNGDRYAKPGYLNRDDILKSKVLKGFEISLGEIFTS